MNKDKVPALFGLILGVALLTYFICAFAPELFLLLDNQQANAHVIGWEKEDAESYIIFSYDHLDGHEYTIRKKIKRPKIDELKDKKEITIKYANHFPGYTLIEGVPDRSYVVLLFGIAVMSVVVYRSIQVFRGKIRPEDFYLTGKINQG